jgi:excisionase family DNA binding protein
MTTNANTITEAISITGLHRLTIRKHIQNGKLPAHVEIIRGVATWLIDAEGLQRFINERNTKPYAQN